MTIQELRLKCEAKKKEIHALYHGNKDNWTDEHQAQFDALEKEISGLDREIDNHDKVMQMEAASAERIEQSADRMGVSVDEAQNHEEQGAEIFRAWLRGGERAVLNLGDDAQQFMAERRERANQFRNTMSTTTDSEGGYIVPEGFGGRLLEELQAYSGVRQVATILPTAQGNPLPFPTMDDTGNTGELLAENAAATDQDVDFGVVTLNAYTYSSKVVTIPIELLQDNGVNIEQVVMDALAVRLGRITNTHYTTGTGSDQPNGIVTAAGSGATGASGATTSVTKGKLLDLIHSVDPAYRQLGCGFMFKDSTLRAIKDLDDGEGRPLWLPNIREGEPNTILGFPYTVNQNMAAMTANAKSILFGNLSKYTIRDVMDVLLLRFDDSAYMKYHRVGFLAFMRTDADLLAPSSDCLKYYQNAAS